MICSVMVGGSILVIALPLPVIIGNFLRNYMRTKQDESVNFDYDESISNEVKNEIILRHPPYFTTCGQPFYLRSRVRPVRLVVKDRPASEGNCNLKVPRCRFGRPLSAS